MGYYLNNASDTTAHIAIPTLVIGTNVGDYIEFKAVANAGNTIYVMCGRYNSTDDNNRFNLQSGSVLLRANSYANALFATGYVQPIVGQVFTIRLTKTGAISWQVHLDGVSIGTANSGATLQMNAFGKRVSADPQSFKGGFYYVEVSTDGGATVTRYYDASASGGSGTTLPDTVNSANNGTTSGAWTWVYYSSGADNESTISYDIGAIDCAISSTIAAPNTTATIAYDIGAITFAASSTVSAPATTATISYDIGAVNFATSATVGVSYVAAFDIGSVNYSISASATSNTSAVIAFDIGEINFDLSALVVSNISTTISYDIGSIDFAVYCTVPTNEPERSLMTKDNVFWRNSIFFKSGRT